MKSLAQTFEEMEMELKRKRLIEKLKKIRETLTETADQIDIQKEIITEEIIRLLELNNNV